MYALVLAIALYICHFAPWVISRPLLFMPLSALFMLRIIRKAERSLEMLILIMLFSILSTALSRAAVSFGFEDGTVSALHGRVIQDSSQKKGRMTGYRLALDAAEDRNGSVASARGSIYVLSEASDLFYGDRVRVSGYVSDGIFIGSSSLVSRPLLTSLRRSIVLLLRDRLRACGEGGELAMRLLLGAGEDGSYGLQEDARLSGLSHVLALSGMHLSILSMIISVPLSILPWRWAGRLAETLFLLFFSFLSGWRPSLVRAFLFRLLLGRKIPLDEAFIFSAFLLFMLFPESVADLGAEYSFISLAAIFLLSPSLDRGLRALLPLPPSFSLSVSASISALLFSIPLTLMVFGRYQLGAVVTSLPLTSAISVYMGISLLVLACPPLSPLLDLSYMAVGWLFRIAARFPEFYGWDGYAALIAASIVLMGLSLLSSGHVEPEL